MIPFYCPIHHHDNADINIVHFNGFPSIYISYFSMNNFNDINSLNNIFSMKIKDDLSINLITACGVNFNMGQYKIKAGLTNTKLFHDHLNYQNYLFTLRWAPYNISGGNNSDTRLYLYYGKKTKIFK
jgi:hypothetical protein